MFVINQCNLHPETREGLVKAHFYVNLSVPQKSFALSDQIEINGLVKTFQGTQQPKIFC